MRSESPRERWTPATSRGRQLRSLLSAGRTAVFVGAHDALSARVAERTGIDGIWASGLAISACMALRDANEASWTQVLEVVEFIADSVAVPVIVDGDTGYGNFNNARRLVRKLNGRGVAAVCLEDKVFPKTNSFLDGDQCLAPIEEFCGKIAACKDHQLDASFCVIARTEALIAGRPVDEALVRAHRYADAGADAVLVHSKKTSPDEIFAFADAWQNRLPLIIVPTTYGASMPLARCQAAKIAGVIWANQAIRASIQAMRQVCRSIAARTPFAEIEQQIATIQDIFDLTDTAELCAAEKKYLRHVPPTPARARARTSGRPAATSPASV